MSKSVAYYSDTYYDVNGSVDVASNRKLGSLNPFPAINLRPEVELTYLLSLSSQNADNGVARPK